MPCSILSQPQISAGFPPLKGSAIARSLTFLSIYTRAANATDKTPHVSPGRARHSEPNFCGYFCRILGTFGHTLPRSVLLIVGVFRSLQTVPARRFGDFQGSHTHGGQRAS